MLRRMKDEIYLRLINSSIYDGLININISYYYNMGSILGILIVVQIISGIMLSMYYVSTEGDSYWSIIRIMTEINAGKGMRYIHSLGVSLIFITMYIHILKGIYNGSYINPRKKIWIIGIIIWLLMIIVGFLGYSIPLGNQSYWAIQVITNLLSIVPYIGGELVEWI